MNDDATPKLHKPSWGGLVDTLRALPDAADVESELKGITALETAQNLDQLTVQLREFFADQTVRDRLNSPLLDAL